MKSKVKAELDELVVKNEKLANFLGKVKTTNNSENLSREQIKLLKKQYSIQKDYIRILEKRLKIWD